MDTLEKTRFLVQYYGSLQGLLVMPAGLLLLFTSVAQQLGWLRQGDMSWALIGALIVCLVCLGIWRYYARRFGRITAGTRNAMKALFGLVSVVFLVAFLWALSIDLKRPDGWSPSLGLVVLGAWFLVIPLFSQGQRRHYYVIGACTAIIALLPLAGIPRVQLLGTRGNWALAMMGAGLTIGGIFDHRLLRRLLSEVREVTVEASC
jgi:hypothetical protein